MASTQQTTIVTAAKLDCPECGAPMMRRYSNRFSRWFYGCSRFPKCDATHGAHPDGSPLGIPADVATKALRIRVHELLDPLWQHAEQCGAYALPADQRQREKAIGVIRRRARHRVYEWLADQMGMTRDDCHVGRFNAEQCVRAKDLLAFVTFAEIRAWSRARWVPRKRKSKGGR